MPKVSFQWFFDLSTVENAIQKITVRAGGKDIIKRLSPQFAAFKYFKLGKISLKMVPASTLPIDPTGLSYSAGENTVDPRDQLTPGMARITNGETVANLPEMTPEVAHEFYNQMVLDRRWFKWSLQSGVKKSAIPLFWSIAFNHQTPYPLSRINVPHVEHQPLVDKDAITGTGKVAIDLVNRVREEGEKPTDEPEFEYGEGPFKNSGYLSGHNVKLSWLPTDDFFNVKDMNAPTINDVPEVDCFTILLPPAYKTKYYYRCYVNETVYFKDMITNYNVGNGPYYASIDRFIRPYGIIQTKPDAPDYTPNMEPFLPISRGNDFNP